MAMSAFVALKTLFIVLMGIMAAMLIYLFYMDRYYSCFNPFNWWVQVAMYHVIMDMVFILIFKLTPEEASKDPIYFVLARRQKGQYPDNPRKICTNFNLDVIWPNFVLWRSFGGQQACKNVMGHTSRHFVTIAKVLVAGIGCYTLGVIIYAIIIEGFPFHNAEEFTPCMITSLVDMHVHIVVSAVHFQSSIFVTFGADISS
ncbi:reverse transcriptase, RNA-dependent DNA polymerase [Tanacetum coccineum]